MSFTKSLRILLVCTLSLTPVAQAEIAKDLPIFSARLNLNYKMLTGKLEMEVSRGDTDNEFVYEVTTVPGAVGGMLIREDAIEMTRFRTRNGRIVPVYYKLNDGMKKSDSITEIEFDWEKMLATTRNEGITREVPLEPNTVDRLTADLMVIRRLRRGQAPGKFRIIDEKSIDTYEFVALGKEEVEVPAGTFTTEKYKRQRKGSRRSVIVWFAPDEGYLPVKLEHQKSGKKTISAAAVEFANKTD